MSPTPVGSPGPASSLPGRGGDGFSPRSVDELATLVRALREDRVPIELRGSGAGRAWARQARAPDHSIRVGAIAGEPEIAPLDLVMSLDAGVPLLRAKTAARGMGLDIALEDPPSGPCTVGGLLARGEGRGAQLAPAGPRAVVLGMDVVLPEGRLIRCGGRVVKNVAGYDTHRLFVGSLGTLGAIARVHMKLVPFPGIEEGWVDESPLATALDRADWIIEHVPHVASLTIECAPDITSHDDPIGPGLLGASARLRAWIRGSRRRVEILRDRLLPALPGHREDAVGARAFDSAEQASLVRATVPRGSLRSLLMRWDDALRADSAAGQWMIHPAAADVWLLLAAPMRPSLRAALAQACRPGGRFLEVWRPADASIPQWDPIPAMYPLWIALRAQLDPDDLWNPGIVRPAGGR